MFFDVINSEASIQLTILIKCGSLFNSMALAITHKASSYN